MCVHRVAGHAVVQLVDACATRRKVANSIPDGVTGIFHCGPGVDSASNTNEYQENFQVGKGGLCVGLTTLTPSCADCHEIRVPQPPGTIRDCCTSFILIMYSSVIQCLTDWYDWHLTF